MHFFKIPIQAPPNFENRLTTLVYVVGSVFYRANEPGTIVVSNFHYTQPGPDAFFWAGERRINGGCNDDNIAPDSYSLAPGQTGSK